MEQTFNLKQSILVWVSLGLQGNELSVWQILIGSQEMESPGPHRST